MQTSEETVANLDAATLGRLDPGGQLVDTLALPEQLRDAVAKMANYYYVQKDYARAIDVFESVLRTQPDAKFLDVIGEVTGKTTFGGLRTSPAEGLLALRRAGLLVSNLQRVGADALDRSVCGRL